MDQWGTGRGGQGVWDLMQGNRESVFFFFLRKSDMMKNDEQIKTFMVQ